MSLKIIAFAAALAAAASADAAVNLVSNGSFEQSIYTANSEFGVDFGQGVTDWTATLPGGYSHYWFGGTQTSVNPANRFGGNNETLANSATALSPDGGNFIGIDADFVGDAPPTFGPYNSPIDQTINGLTVGQTYRVKFYWAATQLKSRGGATDNQVFVTFGGTTQSTAQVFVADQGFSGWFSEAFDFTATSATETLSFLARGGPAGLPPYALLDGVSLTAVPEPATWGLMIAGFAMVGAAARRRRTNTVAA